MKTKRVQFCKICNVAHAQGKKHIAKLPDYITVKVPSSAVKVHKFHEYFMKFGNIKKYEQRLDGTNVFIDYYFKNPNVYSNIVQKDHWLFGTKLEISWHYAPTSSIKGLAAEAIIKKKKKKSIKVVKEESGASIFNFQYEGTTFSKQVEHLQSFLQETDEAEAKKNWNIMHADLTEALVLEFPLHQLHFVGSAITGLGFKWNYLDVSITNVKDCNELEVLTLKKIKLLICTSKMFACVRLGKKGSRSIIECRHAATQIRCDLNITNKLAILNSKLIKYYLTLDEKVKPLMIIIKFWAKQQSLRRISLFSGYALCLLVIFFLQQEPYNLPSVYDLQKDCSPDVEDGWNCAFNTPENKFPALHSVSLLNVVAGFFRFYSNFDYATQVICPYLGTPVKKTAFIKPHNLPDSYQRYMTQNEILHLNCAICIQDPFEHSKNVSFSASLELSGRFTVLCKRAEQYTTQTETELLRNILTTCEEAPVSNISFNIEKSEDLLNEQEWFNLLKNITLNVLKVIIYCQIEVIVDSESVQVLDCLCHPHIWDNRVNAMKALETQLPSEANDFDIELATVRYIFQHYPQVFDRNYPSTKFMIILTMTKNPCRAEFVIKLKGKPLIFFHVVQYFRLRLPTWLTFVANGNYSQLHENMEESSKAVKIKKEDLTSMIPTENNEDSEMIKADIELSRENIDDSPSKQVEKHVSDPRLPSEGDRVISDSVSDAVDGVLAEEELKPTEEPKPTEEKPKLTEEESKPTEEEPKAIDEESKSIKEEPKPIDEEPKPIKEGPRPIDEELKSIEEEPKPIDEMLKSIDEEPKPIKEGPKPIDEEPKLIDEEPKPIKEGPKPIDGELKPIEEEPKPIDEKLKSTDEVPKPIKEEPKLSEEELKSIDKEPKPIEEEPKPAEEEPKPIEEGEIVDEDSDEEEDVPADFFDDFANEDFMDGLDMVDAWDEAPEKPPQDGNLKKKTHSPISSSLKEFYRKSPEKRARDRYRSHSRSPIRRRRRSRLRSRSRSRDKDKEQKLLSEVVKFLDTGIVPPESDTDADVASLMKDKRRSTEDNGERRYSRSGSKNSRKTARCSRSSQDYESRSSIDSSSSEREHWMGSKRKRSRSGSQDSPSKHKSRKYDDKPKKKSFLEEIMEKLNETHSNPAIPHPASVDFSVPPPTLIPAQTQNNHGIQQYDERFFISDAYPISLNQAENFNKMLNSTAVSLPQVRVNPVIKQNAASSGLSVGNETSTEPVKLNDKQTTDYVKKLFADKKISLSDYLAITAKRAVQSASQDYTLKKIKVISRCQHAINIMSGHRKFSGQESKPTSERKNKPEVKYQSPLRKSTVVRFQFTSPAKISKVDTFAAALDKIMQTLGVLKETEDVDEVKEDTTSLILKASQLNSKTPASVSSCKKCRNCEHRESVSIGIQVSEEELDLTKELLKDSITDQIPSQLLSKEKEKEEMEATPALPPPHVVENIEKAMGSSKTVPELLKLKIKPRALRDGDFRGPLRDDNGFRFEYFERARQQPFVFESASEALGPLYNGAPVSYPIHFVDNGQPDIVRMNQLGNLFTVFNQVNGGVYPNMFGL